MPQLVLAGWVSLTKRTMTSREILCLELEGWVQGLALPRTCCVTMGKSLHLSEPPFPGCNIGAGIVANSMWVRITELLSTKESVWRHQSLVSQLGGKYVLDIL